LQSVCFSGHRPDRLPGQGSPDEPETQRLLAALRERVEDAMKRGKDTFLHGMMAGWDLLAAEQVIAIKERHPHIRLVTVMPYCKNFFFRENCWTDEWVRRAKEICVRHDMFISVAGQYRKGVYYERNRVLVDHASELICYWDGGTGGTKHTVTYARSRTLAIHNLFIPPRSVDMARNARIWLDFYIS